MEKKAKAEAKRLRRMERKQGGDTSAPPEVVDIDQDDSDSAD